MDLAISMVPYIDVERISTVCEYVAPLLAVGPSSYI